jgi:hypothetical protein
MVKIAANRASDEAPAAVHTAHWSARDDTQKPPAALGHCREKEESSVVGERPIFGWVIINVF